MWFNTRSSIHTSRYQQYFLTNSFYKLFSSDSSCDSWSNVTSQRKVQDWRLSKMNKNSVTLISFLKGHEILRPCKKTIKYKKFRMFRVSFVRTVHMINRAKVSGTVIDRSEFHRQMLIVRVKRILRNTWCFVNLYLLKKLFTP